MAANIVIANKDEVFVYISCEKGIAYEIREHFSFQVPGAHFMPKYKAKVWDGIIRLFSMKDYTLYRGLVLELIKWCEENGYTWEYEGANYDTEFSKVEAEEYIKSLNLPERFEVRDYQLTAFIQAIRNKRNVLISPTGSGKSLILYIIIRYLLDHGCMKPLLIVPTIGLVLQMKEDFAEYSELNGWDVDEMINQIYEGQNRFEDKPVTISTWQSIYELGGRYFKQFDAILGDEAHTFKATSLKTIMEGLTNARYRIGTTGTLDGTLTNKMVLEGLFGRVKTVAKSHELMKKGQLADLNIKVLILKHTEEAAKALAGSDYAQEINYLVANEERNRFITNLAVSLEGNTLVLFRLVEKHGKVLEQMIRDKVADGRKVFYVSGETDGEVRNWIRGIVEKENNAIIVASVGTFSTGINIKNLHNVIFGAPSKARIKILQAIGRVLRTSDTKFFATLYDIADDLRWKGKENFTLAHLAERLKMYASERFKFKIYNIQLKGK